MSNSYRTRLMTSTLLVSASLLGTPAWAQDQPTQAQVQEPVQGDTPAQAVDQTQAPSEEPGEEIIVTGSRIARPNLTSNSPIAVVTGEQTVKQGDITLDTFLNTLPQANPAGTTTSNNPGNGGQSNVNLRGLGSNRNLVLIDGRRPMSSGTDLSVDLNTIPQGLIERIEVITGGAGAAYGADAIAGVVNIFLKDDFEGIELRGTYANTVPNPDAREYQISGLLGANFDDGKGNIAISAEYSKREALGKLERPFSQQASSTTGTPPTGRLSVSATNAPTQAAIDAVFATYGLPAGSVLSGSRIGFNADDTLFGVGVFNTPENTVNYRYDPLGLDGAAANQNFYPDFYSYNFDLTNLLVLPLKRKSVFARGNYEIDPMAEVFFQGGYTEYKSQQGLAATPVGVRAQCPTGTNPLRATSPLVECGQGPVALIVPVTNPFIPADLMTILNSRTGNNPALVGSGATEPFQISKRFLDTGLRISTFDNKVLQGLVGLRGDITDRWRYETSYSWGRTTIDAAASGNVNVQNAQALVESPTGGTELCEGGFNPFGVHPISADCVEFLNETGFTSTEFTLKVLQGYVTGDVIDLPAGPLAVVFGAEQRKWNFEFDPGTLFGPIAGFNTADPAAGKNKFTDFFAEARIPLFKDQPFARSAEVNLTFRRSKSKFTDLIPDDPDEATGGSTDNAYGITGSWEPLERVRLRGSYQHSVRAPNFVELFAGGSSFPQYFDPCSINTNFRMTGGAAARRLCEETGLGPVDSPTSAAQSYVQTPGSQAFIGVTGNPDLKPETGDTFTVGGVFQRWGVTASLDYYNIRIKDSIFAPDPNMIIAACYGYHGLNPSLAFSSPFCSFQPADGRTGSIFARVPTISYISIPVALGGDGNGYFQSINQGKIKTSGVDVQLGYALPTDFVSPGSKLSANLLVNYLIDFKVEELPGTMIDYAGTVSYFGAGLGTSFPRWKGNLNLAWNMKPFTLESRIRYIHKMANRITRQFPGEEALVSGTPSVFYFDFGVAADFKPLTLRIGLNNAFNRRPPEYSPNVQSGTDPSLFDVIGRRAYVSATLRY
jgi:iron complex outermembrane receptor protein